MNMWYDVVSNYFHVTSSINLTKIVLCIIVYCVSLMLNWIPLDSKLNFQISSLELIVSFDSSIRIISSNTVQLGMFFWVSLV